jgi:hypothetical protein
MGDGEVQIGATARWAAAGHSPHADPAVAGREAVVAALDGPEPRLVLVFARSAYELGPLMEAAREAAGAATLIGCSTAAVIAAGGSTDPGIAAFAIGGPGFQVATASADIGAAGAGAHAADSADALRAAGAQVAGCLDGVASSPYRALVMVADRRGGDPQEVVRGAYAVAGPSVQLVGGGASAGDGGERSWVFDGEGVREQALVAVAIGSQAPFGVGVRHGWTPLPAPLLVSSSEGEWVMSLNDRPALDVYLESAGAPEEAWTDPEAFAGFAQRHPLGLAGRSGEPRAVFVAAADFADRGLRCDTELPHGVLAWVLHAEPDAVLAAAGAACEEAVAALGGRDLLGLVAFDCVNRRALLGPGGASEEAARIAAVAGGAPHAGGYCYGQVARAFGSAGYHNHSLAVLALA